MNFSEYREAAHLRYGALAQAVAAILNAAIAREGGYRLQLIKERAKAAASLHKKLVGRGMLDSATLDTDIKDLAGCRIVFYTDRDVATFLNSGIVESNFEVVDRKIHYPARESQDVTELYISNHFVVRLTAERLSLPEYAGFAGMQCEVQVQTILNHSWSEMAHDTIYKEPDLGEFGAAHFAAIKERLAKVARKYLAPAGYEFQKIASDFERLVRGKKLDDEDALGAIAAASDNNDRAEALRVFTDDVLPYYREREGACPKVVAGLMAGLRAAHGTEAKAIETEYGSFPGRTFESLLASTTRVLSQIRYEAPDETFDAALELYRIAPSEDERSPILELANALASHNVHVWQQYGPAMQQLITRQIAGIGDDGAREVRPMLLTMLGQVLSPNAEGTSSSSASLTIHQGTVVASAELRQIRTAALDQLERMYFLAETERERLVALAKMRLAADHPMRGSYGAALSRLIADDARRVTEFETRVVAELSLAGRQKIESQVLHRLMRFAPVPEWLSKEDSELEGVWSAVVTAAQTFNASVNADEDYRVFKVLVGYDSAYPTAWTEPGFDYARDQAYRDAEIERLLATVTVDSFEVWYDRICRYAATESDDLATFPKFAEFIQRIAAHMPDLGFAMVDRLDHRMSSFLPAMLRGLRESDQRDRAERLIAQFIEGGLQLENIAWHFRFGGLVDLPLLRAVLESAQAHANREAARICVIAAAEAYSATETDVIEEVFLPAVRYLDGQGDTSWIDSRLFSWMSRPILVALSETQARQLLDAMLPHPDFSHGMDQIAGALARHRPAAVIDWLGRRLLHRVDERRAKDYDAIPFEVFELKEPLAVHPALMLAELRHWFERDPGTFPYTGGRLLASLFPACPEELFGLMDATFRQAPEDNAGYVLAILQAYEGRPCIYELVRVMVATFAEGSPFLDRARLVLEEGGVVTGEYGFANRAQRRMELVAPWLEDENAKVRAFAADYRRDLERTVAHETRRADHSLAMRRLDYGEDPLQPEVPAGS